MQIFILEDQKQIVIDGDSLDVPNWSALKIPPSIKVAFGDTEKNTGYIQWDDEFPILYITYNQFESVFKSCIAAFEHEKHRREEEAREAIRIQAEEQAKNILAEANDKLSNLKKLKELRNTVGVVSERLLELEQAIETGEKEEL